MEKLILQEFAVCKHCESFQFASTARDWHCKSFQFASTARVYGVQALHCKRLWLCESVVSVCKFFVLHNCGRQVCGDSVVPTCCLRLARPAACCWARTALQHVGRLWASAGMDCRKWECMYNIYNFIVMTLHAHVHTYFHTPRKILLLLSSRISVSNSENMTYDSVQALWETGIARIFSLQALREFTVCKHCAALHCAGSSQTHADGRCCCHVSTSSGGKKSALNVC